jgi:hypothetical protein
MSQADRIFPALLRPLLGRPAKAAKPRANGSFRNLVLNLVEKLPDKILKTGFCSFKVGKPLNGGGMRHQVRRKLEQLLWNPGIAGKLRRDNDARRFHQLTSASFDQNCIGWPKMR